MNYLQKEPDYKPGIIIALAGIILMLQFADAQGSAGTEAKYEPRYLIDLPTAGMIPHGNLALDLDFYQNGGLLMELSIGAFDHFLFGVSYGGTDVIGNDKPVWNDAPGFQIRFRIINETMILPAIGLGFDSQGKEFFNEKNNRYTIKSPGFYAVVSKNYDLLGNLSLHGGANYSLERADGDRDPNLFFGAEKTLGPIISVLTEYNIGWNDSHNNALGRGRGYFNIGARISVGDGFSIGLSLKDILKNQKEETIGNRTVSIEYVKSL